MSELAKWILAAVISLALSVGGGTALAQQADVESEEPAQQDDVSKALDSTATQWSFQFAWQGTDWKDDIVNGQPRQPGHDNFVQ